MARIRTFALRRLDRLRRRQNRVRSEMSVLRSTYHFRYDASLRIAGVGAWHEEIERRTGLRASIKHRRGEARSSRTHKQWDEDLWLLASPLDESAPLEDHLEWLANAVEPHLYVFREIIDRATWADVCLGCLSESGSPMLAVRPDALRILRQLNVGCAFNFTCV